MNALTNKPRNKHSYPDQQLSTTVRDGTIITTRWSAAPADKVLETVMTNRPALSYMRTGLKDCTYRAPEFRRTMKEVHWEEVQANAHRAHVRRYLKEIDA